MKDGSTRSILRSTLSPIEMGIEFVRASDRVPMSFELRFHGESYSWEAQFFERCELYFGHGAFATRAGAIRWV